MHSNYFKSWKAAAALALSATLVAGSIPVTNVLAANEKKTDMTATEVVTDMTVGFNIGNTLDSYNNDPSNFPLKNNNETGWGNPEISEELIQAIGAGGFNTVRLPVSWGQYAVGDDYELPGFILERVKEVVDYCIDNDMYVILNTHHEISDYFDFYYPNSENKERSEKFLTSIWSQVAEEFKDYDSHLVFETMNEPRMVGHQAEWWFYRQGPTADVIDAIECINDFNQVSLDAIRATGGNNATRCVMVPGYDASIDGAMVDQFKLPEDTAKDRLIVSVHAYTPYSFALEAYGTDKFTNTTDLDNLFADLDSKFLSKGTPVVIGEMGASNKNNLSERMKWADYYFGLAEKYDNLAMAIWDNNVFKSTDSPGECHGYINRITGKWREPELIETVMKHVSGTPAKSYGNSGNSGNNGGQSTPAAKSGRAGEIVRDMTVGWNIGNALENVAEHTTFPVTISQETASGNIAITKEMIDEVAKAGFNTIRIPVSWGQYTTGSDYKIPAWLMSRVKEIADYAIADGMYVIIDSHRDISDVCQFYYPDDAHRDESIKYLTSIWTQIATAFKNYDDKVLFETMNEPRLVGESEEWWFPRANPGARVEESVACINDYNQACLDAIRKAGGKNADRCVIVCGYDSSIDGVMVNGFELPKDIVDNRIIVAVHAYTPYYFALEPYSNVVEKFDDSKVEDIDLLFYDLKKKFISKGTPVIISETGCLKRSNNHDERIKWINYYWGGASQIADLAICLNDNNVFETWGTGLGLLNRKTLKWDDPEFISTVMKYVDGTPAKINGVVVKPDTDESTAESVVEPTKESVVEPTKESVVEPTKESVVEPTKESVVEPTKESVVEPTKESVVEPTKESVVEPTKESVVEPSKESTVESSKEPTPVVPTKNGLKAIPLLNDWGSGFQYIVTVKNEGAKVETWTVKVKKSDIKIESSWCVNIKEVGEYYVITPFFWNAVLDKGQSISFGVQGTKRASTVKFTIE